MDWWAFRGQTWVRGSQTLNFRTVCTVNSCPPKPLPLTYIFNFNERRIIIQKWEEWKTPLNVGKWNIPPSHILWSFSCAERHTWPAIDVGGFWTSLTLVTVLSLSTVSMHVISKSSMSDIWATNSPAKLFLSDLLATNTQYIYIYYLQASSTWFKYLYLSGRYIPTLGWNIRFRLFLLLFPWACCRAPVRLLFLLRSLHVFFFSPT